MKTLHCLLLLFGVALAGCAREERTHADAAPARSGLASGDIVLPADSPKLQQIRVEAVGTAEVPTGEVVASGKIETNANRVSRVVLPVAGRVQAVLVRLGDSVREGQPLLEVSSPDADAAVGNYLQAAALLAQAKAGMLKAQADLDRVRDLYSHDAVAKKEVLNGENAAVQAATVAEQAEASLRQAASRLELLGLKPGDFAQKVTVRAPIGGKILDIAVAPGEYRNDLSAALLTIADLRAVWVAADVPESYIRLIRTGEPVEIELSAFPGETLSGRVARIGDTVDSTTRTVKVRADLENPAGRFKPEMYARIKHVSSRRELPVVPAGAVLEGARGSTVFREMARGVFREASVKTAPRDGGVIPILEGLKPGDRIVVDGAMLLK